jgi:hypothetical protein
MRLSEALSPSVWIEVPFAEGAVLRVKYRPSKATLADMQELSSKTGTDQVGSIVNTFLEMIEEWDMFEDDNETVVPLEYDRLMNIPASIFRRVLEVVTERQSSGEAASSSRDG